MVFASLIFLYVFLPINLVLYYLLRSITARNLLLIGFSLAFYAWGEPVWVSLLIITSIVDYCHGLLIERFRGTVWAKAALASSITINVGLLVGFKYSAFLCEIIGAALSTTVTVPTFALPIGISFYTFQALSYVADVYRGDVPAQRSYIKFLLFISLYHQLVAGPIVRYAHIAGEVERRQHPIAGISAGVTRFCLGLFKKVCIANVAGLLVLRFMEADPAQLSSAEAWFGLLMFSLQIYFDFSAYSDMAIGLGLMFGFHYHENFDYPYIARSATDFWRRWHISLGSFFRDYVYIPLGGNRRRPYRNLFVVWGLTGLWHGASWNFVLWGLYFAVLIALERLILHRVLRALPAVVGHLYLLFAVVLGWALFYFDDLDRLGAYLQRMFGGGQQLTSGPGLEIVVREHCFWLALTLVMCAPLGPWLRRWFAAQAAHRPALAPWGAGVVTLVNLGALILATAMLVGKTYNPFLYFRF
ncbi:MAG: MBOAT family protein [Nannocystis sp.]|nr:MBOAT family O-acyltransferase [Nannocystis sp.]MBA3548618.1 MBOAT family protein [Nannocystis sp.]